MSIAFVSIRTNTGDRAATVQSAVRALANAGEVFAVSSVYESTAIEIGGRAPSLHLVAKLETWLAAEELTEALLIIALENGGAGANSAAALDLDLLLFDDECRSSRDLVIPHPRLTEGVNVLVPLAELAADLVVPGTDKTINDLLWPLDRSGIARYSAPPVF